MGALINNTKAVGIRLLRWGLLAFGMLVGLYLVVSLGLSLLENVSGEQLARMREALAQANYMMQFVRWGLYAAAYYYWTPMIRRFGAWRGWDDAVIERGIASRRSTTIIILMVELFLFQTIHVSILEWLR